VANDNIGCQYISGCQDIKTKPKKTAMDENDDEKLY
jgi:hypothetical protein